MALRAAAGQAFFNTSNFNLRDLRNWTNQQQLRADFEEDEVWSIEVPGGFVEYPRTIIEELVDEITYDDAGPSSSHTLLDWI